MKAIWKGISKVLFYAISLALLVYAAARSLEFVTATLPPDQQIVGYLALAATSGGAIAWLMVFMYSAQGTGQKVISGLMTGIDLLGEFALFTFETLRASGQAGMIEALAPEEVQMVILGLSALIAVNILATFAYHLVDPEHAREMREAAVKDDLENKALKLIEKQGEQLAGDLAPQLAAQWAADFEKRFNNLNALGLGRINQQQPAPAPTRPAPARKPGFSLLPWKRKAAPPLAPLMAPDDDDQKPVPCMECGQKHDSKYSLVFCSPECELAWLERGNPTRESELQRIAAIRQKLEANAVPVLGFSNNGHGQGKDGAGPNPAPFRG